MAMKKILVVDDDPVILKLLEQHLTYAGYEVLIGKNGCEAVAAAKEKHPNLILLDVSMPDMDGGEVAQELRGNPATKNIPIIFLTGILSKEEERAAGNVIAGNIFIAKPYEREKLLALVRQKIN